jgi:predicted nucleotidyltransferase
MCSSSRGIATEGRIARLGPGGHAAVASRWRPAPDGKLALVLDRPIPRDAAIRFAERAAELLARDPRVVLVYVFGSAAQTGVESVRDVDVAVALEPHASFAELLALRARLEEELRVPIDLVSLDDASVVLAHEIAEGGRCLFARGDREVEFVTRARSRYWDFAPYLAEQWRLSGERLAERRLGS